MRFSKAPPKRTVVGGAGSRGETAFGTMAATVTGAVPALGGRNWEGGGDGSGFKAGTSSSKLATYAVRGKFHTSGPKTCAEENNAGSEAARIGASLAASGEPGKT